jgi:hypothetical protein
MLYDDGRTPAAVDGPVAPPANMGPQPERIDHWDAYVCRFDDRDGDDEDGRWRL